VSELTPERYEKLPKYAQAELNRLWIADQRRAELLGAAIAVLQWRQGHGDAAEGSVVFGMLSDAIRNAEGRS
jgi:hypothetical protein